LKLWILAEERPKVEVIKQILNKISEDFSYDLKVDKIFIKPVFIENHFSFEYIVEGAHIPEFSQIVIRIVSGGSSFVDFLIYFSDNEPCSSQEPVYAIEETKTSDKESRNTGIYQRSSKFVYVNLYYPNCKKIMLYNLRVKDNFKPTETNIFGSRLLKTIGVEIIGKIQEDNLFRSFKNIEEIIEFKSKMRKAPKGNVPITINKHENKILISGRLYKSGSLSHDPNIGALSLISQTLRNLGWNKEIIITNHKLSDSNLGIKNKFIQIANELNIVLDGLKMPKTILPKDYWHFENNSEKIVSIFLHLLLDQLDNYTVIYENHAGCERGYFYTNEGVPTTVHKYIKNKKSNGIIYLPDLIVRDDLNKTIYTLEAKRYERRMEGLKEINNFYLIEEEYIKYYYPDYKIIRGVVIYGGTTSVTIDKIYVQINCLGEIFISDNAPSIFKKEIKNIIPV